MKKLILLSSLLIGLFALTTILTSFSPKGENTNRDNTPGTVTFSVSTQSEGGGYAPKHVLAIWVEKDGVFVKTRKAMANQRKQYLYTWRAASNYNVVDAITGSTINSHQSHTIEWDCTDLDGNVVPDGNYTMLIEFTEKHAQGPLFSIDFEKGAEAINITPPNEPHFINMEFSYEPGVVLTADFTSDIQEACVTETIVFTDNSTGATTWQWNFGDNANPASASTQGPHEVMYNSAGSKTVSLTIDQGITQTKTDYITITPNAIAGYTYIQENNTITFTNTSQNAVSYQWDFDDGNTSTEENPVHEFEENGSYDVTLSAVSETCGNDLYTETILINTIGISDLETITGIEVYPNPGNGIFNITPLQNLTNANVKIFDVQGKIVFCNQYEFISSGTIVTGGNDQLQPGMYFLNAVSDEGKWQKKLLVK